MYATLQAATNGAFDDVPVEKIKAAEDALLRELKSKQPKLVDALNTGDKPTDTQNETILKIAKSVAASYKAVKKTTKE
jgi:F0F1-type ATP synthase alpha subunit